MSVGTVFPELPVTLDMGQALIQATNLGISQGHRSSLLDNGLE